MHGIETVAVLGTTDDGTACAVVAALAGCAVRLHGGSHEALEAAAAEVRRRVDLAYAQGALTPSEVQRILDGVLFTTDLEEALTGADLVADAAGGADAAPEVLAASVRASTAVAALGASPARLAAALPQPGRVLSLRLVPGEGPLPRVEAVAAPATVPHVLARARTFAARSNRAARLPDALPPEGSP